MPVTKTPSVLIIEDDRDVAALYRHTLDIAGYHTAIAVNGIAALENLHQSAPDIVLLDLSLPGISGIEVFKELKSDRRLSRIRVVVVTGYSQFADNLPAEPDLILMKPVSPAQLTDLVWRLFEDDKTVEKHPFSRNPWDKTTGLYNRSFFLNRLAAALQNSKLDPEKRFGVLLVSPDQNLPARLEKRRREALLQGIANSIKSSVRPTDTLARFDRGHFYILVENLPMPQILSMIAGRIQMALDRDQSGDLRFRIGAVYCDSGYEDPAHIMSDVEAARSLAGVEGSLRVRIFDRPSLRSAVEPSPTEPV